MGFFQSRGVVTGPVVWVPDKGSRVVRGGCLQEKGEQAASRQIPAVREDTPQVYHSLTKHDTPMDSRVSQDPKPKVAKAKKSDSRTSFMLNLHPN